MSMYMEYPREASLVNNEMVQILGYFNITDGTWKWGDAALNGDSFH